MPLAATGLGDLLELADEPRPLLALLRRVDGRLLQQQPLDEVEDHAGDTLGARRLAQRIASAM